jgi:hypothetical protein
VIDFQVPLQDTNVTPYEETRAAKLFSRSAVWLVYIPIVCAKPRYQVFNMARCSRAEPSTSRYEVQGYLNPPTAHIAHKKDPVDAISWLRS